MTGSSAKIKFMFYYFQLLAKALIQIKFNKVSKLKTLANGHRS